MAIFFWMLALCHLLPAFAGTLPVFVPESVPVTGADWKDGNDTFSFAILGDKTSDGEDKWPVFDKAVAEINLFAPDFAITTGDHIPGHMEKRSLWDREWETYLEHANALQCPLVMTAGNHDIANKQCYNFWKEDFGATYYHFLYRDCMFLVLNTEEERFDGRGPVWEKMMTFAEDTLVKHKTVRHTFMFFHKPMWTDPRFKEDWLRLRTALETRPFTAIAGHEHYLSVDYDNGNPLVIMNATGGGVHESKVRAIGGFHAYALVTVRESEVHIAIIEPGGGIQPLDCAPASFRSAINHDVVRLNAEQPLQSDTAILQINAAAFVRNPFDEEITVRIRVAPLEQSGWPKPAGVDFRYDVEKDAAIYEVTLMPGKEQRVPMMFEVPPNAVATPPAVTWSVQYNGEWLDKEPMRMEEVNVVPIYPVNMWRAVHEWMVLGPFPIGEIDTRYLPDDPMKANPNIFTMLGPEQGYQKDAVFEGDLIWHSAQSDGNGLLNHNAILGTQDIAAAYNSVSVHTVKAQQTYILLYADNFAQLYLNGELQEGAQAFNAPGGFVYVPVALTAGWNTIVVKVINNRGDWFLRCLIADPENNLAFCDINK